MSDHAFLTTLYSSWNQFRPAFSSLSPYTTGAIFRIQVFVCVKQFCQPLFTICSFSFSLVYFSVCLNVLNWMVPSHAIKVVKGNFVHVQPQTPVCKLAFQNYTLNTSFYDLLLVFPLPSLFPCPSSACRHSRLWTGLTLAVIGSDTSSNSSSEWPVWPRSC